MNKTELIDHIAASTAIPKAAATRALEAVLSAVTTTLKNSGIVTLVGFGTFTWASARPAPAAIRAPATKFKIAAAQVPKFKPGKA